MPSFDLTALGLQTPRFPEARALVVERWRLAYGENAQTAEDSPDGLMIDILTILLGLAWEANAEIYANSFLRTASGNQVDLILDLFGRRRRDAAPSTASVVLAGTDTTVVPAGTVLLTTGNEARFETDAGATIGDDDRAFFVRVLAAVNGATYRLEVDGQAVPYGAGPGDDTVSIAQQLADSIDANALITNATALASPLPGPDGEGIVVVESIDGTPIAVVQSGSTTPANLPVADAVRVGVTAVEDGPTVALAGTIVQIETPVSGLARVVNTADATLGRNREPDAAYKRRHLDTLRSSGRATDLAIRDALLDRVDGVTQAIVISNRTSLVDGDGRPPHSFESIVLGGTDGDVAASIFATGPAGIQAFGAVVVNVDNGQGGTVAIGFSRPTPRYLHLRVTVTPGEGFPSVGNPVAAIVAGLVAHFGQPGPGELQIGTDFYRYQAATPINASYPGIANAVVETDATANPGDAPTFASQDIVVDDDEVLLIDSSRIEVVIV